MNGMQVYDPYAYTYQLLNEAVTARPVGDYIPVRSLKEGKWFALYLPSNKSHRIANIARGLQGLIEREIDTLELVNVLLEACSYSREGLYEEASPSNVRSANMDAIDTYGAYATLAARIKARGAGFTQAEIEQAFVHLECVPAMEKVLEGVEVVDVGELTEG